MTEMQRKTVLESDQRAETVEADQVLCRKCKKWIKLSKRYAYSLGNWNAHQAACADAALVLIFPIRLDWLSCTFVG
jgi:hypothetical protein